ncbi:MAG: S9 family peptidase [Deltaproteobacteria bacterium]|nr:S9 family peptidase [Deltaproteobacteria bacterium]
MPEDLIPRVHLFGNPTRAAAEISPDGTRLSFLAPLDGVLNVWVCPVDDVDAARPITRDTGRGIRFHGWVANSTHVLYMQDKDGDENWRLYSVDLATDTVLDLTPFEGVQGRFVQGSWDFPNEVLIGLNNRDPQWHDVYRVDVVTGESRLVEQNDRFVYYVADRTLALRLAAESTPEGGFQLFERKEGEWKPMFSWGRDDALTSGPVMVDARRNLAWIKDSRKRDTAALVSMNLETGERTVVGESDHADVAGVLVHPTTRKVEAWSENYERIHWHVLDPAVAADLERLRAVARGDLDVVSRNKRDDQWVVVFTPDDGPATYYHYDRTTGIARKLFTTRPELEGAPLTRMHPAIIRARDGLDLVSYLSLPRLADPEATGRPATPLPMVLVVHGGPWARDEFGYNVFHQWLANRGYAVLSVNFRGSTGFGKAFLNGADHEWGRRMHEDLLDAVQWAIDEGVAQPDRIAIMGGSYGGYATLVGLTFTPERFACGVDIVGPSNLETLLATIPPYWKPVVETFTKRVGDPGTEAGRALLRERSPLHRAHAIARPLLIGQGANDPRVKQAESDQIVSAMQDNGLRVTYVLFPDEGHGFARPENNLAFFGVSEAFLARCLGGTYQPLGDDLEGSSLEVPVGGEHVPGLTEALEKKA